MRNKQDSGSDTDAVLGAANGGRVVVLPFTEEESKAWERTHMEADVFADRGARLLGDADMVYVEDSELCNRLRFVRENSWVHIGLAQRGVTGRERGGVRYCIGSVQGSRASLIGPRR